MALRDVVLRNIKALMKLRDIPNFTELARLSGVAQPTLQRFNAGTHESINFQALEKIAATLDVPASRLFDDRYSLPADEREASVLLAMEALPDWGKDALLASAKAMAAVPTPGTKPSPGSR